MGIMAVALSMLVIMLCVRKKMNIGLAMLIGAGVLAVGAPMTPLNIFAAVKAAFVDQTTWDLMLIILLIGILGHILKASGALNMMVETLLRLLGDARWLMATIPGVIGLLTVPGGAMMSAPMVDQLGDQVEIGPEHKTGINLVFRHLTYLIFPMMSSMILAASLAGVTTMSLVVQNLPAMAAGLIASWYFLLRGITSRENKGHWSFTDVRWFIVSILPIVVVLTLFLGLDIYFPMALVFGILTSMVIIPGGEGSLSGRMMTVGMERARTMLRPGFKPDMILVVLGIMVYKEILHGSSLVTTFAQGLVEMGIPTWVLLIIMPFAVGMVTGVHTATIGIVVPIFLPLLSPETFMAELSLLYISSTVGYVISPLHLCLILTREFYQAKFASTYRYITPVAGCIIATALIMSGFRGMVW